MNELREQYEDALFRLLMEQVTQMEIELLIKRKEALRNDPEAAVSMERSDRCLEFIQKLLKRRQRPARRKALRIALTILAAVLAMTALAYAAIPQVQVDINNALLVIRGEDTIEYMYADDQFALGEGILFRASLPESFYETEHKVWENEHMEEVTYYSSEDESISLNIWLNYFGTGNTTMIMDRERANIEEERELPRNGMNVQAEMVGNDEELFVYWLETEFRASVMVDGCGLTPDQMWEIVESMEVYPPPNAQ